MNVLDSDFSVEYITHSGDDLLVVNAARVSFQKEKEEFGDDDERLIHFLAKHSHWTPFGHPQITFRIKAPLFVRTQLFKHKQGFVENEVSRRYVSSEPSFYYPFEGWREAPEKSIKQGSGGLIQDYPRETYIDELYDFATRSALNSYNEMLKSGVCPEQARMILPQCMMTEWFWTGSLAAYSRVFNLRTSDTAQKETKIVVEKVGRFLEELFPISWKYLTKKEEND